MWNIKINKKRSVPLLLYLTWVSEVLGLVIYPLSVLRALLQIRRPRLKSLRSIQKLNGEPQGLCSDGGPHPHKKAVWWILGGWMLHLLALIIICA